jgi:ubiquinone/menaquinone biosynthesis C-methylase UbiE
MKNQTNWKDVWEQKASASVSDFELDRGRRAADEEVEYLSALHLINFINPDVSETLLDAGCGTGVNILRLHSRVRKIVGIDYAQGSLDRCKKAIQAQQITNAQVCVASVTALPLPDNSVNKVVCLSVFQYLDDDEVRQALKEFARVLRPGGTLILHVKNLSSLYWSTLRLAKRIKLFLGRSTRIEHFRSFAWYTSELARLSCKISGYDSFNLLLLDGMPPKLVTSIRRFELKHHANRLSQLPIVRRHGAELIIKATVQGTCG